MLSPLPCFFCSPWLVIWVYVCSPVCSVQAAQRMRSDLHRGSCTAEPTVRLTAQPQLKHFWTPEIPQYNEAVPERSVFIQNTPKFSNSVLRVFQEHGCGLGTAAQQSTVPLAWVPQGCCFLLAAQHGCAVLHGNRWLRLHS